MSGTPGHGWRALVLTGALSVAAHAGVLIAMMPRAEAVQIAGGGGGALAALGNDFSDFVQGTIPSRLVETGASESTEATQTPPEAARAILPDNLPDLAPLTPAPQTTARAAPIPLADVAASSSPRAIALTQVAAVAPQAVPPRSAPRAAALLIPSAAIGSATGVASGPVPQPARPVAPDTLAPAPEVEVRQAGADTPHPRRRPDPVASPAPEPASQPASAAQPQGNSDRDARRGTAEGVVQGATTQAPSAQAGAAPGNADVSNYPGQVLRRIQRVRQARLSARGTAVVAFTIGGDGGLASVRVARASGSAALDAAALDHIRRATPFPPPPAGAQRQFSFEFVGR